MNRPQLRRVLTAALIALWMGAFVATHLPQEGLPDVDVPDKTAHLAGYLVLGLALLATLTAYDVRPRWRAAIALAALWAYGALDELTQPWFRRSAGLSDWVFDAAGALAAVAVWEAIAAWRRRQTPRTSPNGERRVETARPDHSS